LLTSADQRRRCYDERCLCWKRRRLLSTGWCCCCCEERRRLPSLHNWSWRRVGAAVLPAGWGWCKVQTDLGVTSVAPSGSHREESCRWVECPFPTELIMVFVSNLWGDCPVLISFGLTTTSSQLLTHTSGLAMHVLSFSPFKSFLEITVEVLIV
jgi:hypothetical protein